MIEADGDEDARKHCKALTWPLMDDPDALPSSFVNKVLTCISKWSFKLEEMNGFIEAIDDPNKTLSQFFVSSDALHVEH